MSLKWLGIIETGPIMAITEGAIDKRREESVWRRRLEAYGMDREGHHSCLRVFFFFTFTFLIIF